MQIKNEKLRIFLRRKGSYIAGGALVAAFIGLMILGKTQNVYIGEDYISPERAMQDYAEQLESYSADADDLWDNYYGLKDLGLNYSAHIDELDGEMFIYSVELDRPVTDEDVNKLSDQITVKCGRLSEENDYGEYFIEKTGEQSLNVILDLGNANTTKAITGIFKALNEIDGVTAATVNSKYGGFSKDYSRQVKAPDADAETYEESSRAWAEYAERIRQHFDSLGLYFPVDCEALTNGFSLYIDFEEKPDADTEAALSEKLGALADKENRTWTVTRYEGWEDNCIALIVTADAFEYIQPEEAALCDSMLKALNSDFKGIKEVSIF